MAGDYVPDDAPGRLRRPHGGQVIMAGGIVLLIGLILGLFAYTADPYHRYGGGLDPDRLAIKALFFWGSAAMVSLGTLLLLAGYIVRAIWFLPGDDERPYP